VCECLWRNAFIAAQWCLCSSKLVGSAFPRKGASPVALFTNLRAINGLTAIRRSIWRSCSAQSSPAESSRVQPSPAESSPVQPSHLPGPAAGPQPLYDSSRESGGCRSPRNENREKLSADYSLPDNKRPGTWTRRSILEHFNLGFPSDLVRPRGDLALAQLPLARWGGWRGRGGVCVCVCVEQAAPPAPKILASGAGESAEDNIALFRPGRASGVKIRSEAWLVRDPGATEGRDGSRGWWEFGEIRSSLAIRTRVVPRAFVTGFFVLRAAVGCVGQWRPPRAQRLSVFPLLLLTSSG
jgi:hypothetical protein